MRELKRRKVFHVATVYAITAWAAINGAAQLFPVFEAPPWAVKAFIGVALLGFPIAIVLAWAFEVTPDGQARRAAALSRGTSLPSTALFGASGVVHVTWKDASGTSREHVFDQPFAIGRDPTCGVRFEEAVVSRRHAEVSHEHGVWYVADLGSRNGTLLDGKPVTRAVLPERGTIGLSEAGPRIDFELRSTSATTTRIAWPASSG